MNQRQIDAQVEIFGLVGANTASGTLTITGTGYLSLTGLPFTPKYIEIYGYMASTNEWSRGSATDPALQTVLWGGVIGGVFETRQYT